MPRSDRKLSADRHLACYAFIVAVDTRPNIGLAVRARLHHGRGVTVNDHLQTSDRNIYAAGEIAENRSELYGITPAAEEQAAIAAAQANVLPCPFLLSTVIVSCIIATRCVLPCRERRQAWLIPQLFPTTPVTHFMAVVCLYNKGFADRQDARHPSCMVEHADKSRPPAGMLSSQTLAAPA